MTSYLLITILLLFYSWRSEHSRQKIQSWFEKKNKKKIIDLWREISLICHNKRHQLGSVYKDSLSIWRPWPLQPCLLLSPFKKTNIVGQCCMLRLFAHPHCMLMHVVGGCFETGQTDAKTSNNVGSCWPTITVCCLHLHEVLSLTTKMKWTKVEIWMTSGISFLEKVW